MEVVDDLVEDVSDSDEEQEVYYECSEQEQDDGKSSDFLFKDSYFEDRELDGLEYCYEPGIALGQMEYGSNFVPSIYRKVSASGVAHCFGCRCQRMSQFGPCSGCQGESGSHILLCLLGLISQSTSIVLVLD